MNKPSPTPQKRRWWRWLAIPILLIALLLGGLLYLVATPSGARRLGTLAMRWEPRLSLQVQGGTLWRGLRLAQVSWKDAPMEITLASLDAKWGISFRPRPSLDCEFLHLQDLIIHDGRPVPPKPDPDLPWFERLDPSQRSPLSLTDIHLPLNLRVGKFTLERASLIREDKTRRIESLKTSADLIGPDLTIRTMALDSEQGHLSASGTLQLSGELGHASTARPPPSTAGHPRVDKSDMASR